VIVAIGRALSLRDNRGLKPIGTSPRARGEKGGALHGPPAVFPVGGRAPILKIAMPVPRSVAGRLRGSQLRLAYLFESQGPPDQLGDFVEQAMWAFWPSVLCGWDSGLFPVANDARVWGFRREGKGRISVRGCMSGHREAPPPHGSVGGSGEYLWVVESTQGRDTHGESRLE